MERIVLTHRHPDHAAGAARLAELAGAPVLAPSRILPGHGPEVARAGEKIEEYLAHRREREARVVAALDSGARSLAEVVESAYALVPPPLRPYAELSARAHLLKLGRRVRS